VSDFFSQPPLLVEHYENYLIDQDMATYVRRVSLRYGIGTLERIATNGDRTARRAAVLALGRLADYHTNAVLGRSLIDRDRGVRTLAENGIRRLWMRLGTSSQQRRMTAIVEATDDRDYQRAIELATALVQESPWIAEGWYLRGKAYFHLEQFEATTRDCHQALEINAYHFVAASVMGQAFQHLNNPVVALESFRRALRLNPSMEEVRAQVIYLQRSLKGE